MGVPDVVHHIPAWHLTLALHIHAIKTGNSIERDKLCRILILITLGVSHAPSTEQVLVLRSPSAPQNFLLCIVECSIRMMGNPTEHPRLGMENVLLSEANPF